VSPDGNVVVFQHCTSTNVGCDIFAARRNALGLWGTPVAITSGGGNDLSPVTNGTIVVYSSDTGIAGDFDIYYEPVTGIGTATRLDFSEATGSDEENPNISGTLISMERTLPGAVNADLYLFDIATSTLFQLPETPEVDEHLNDVSMNADGTVHVAFAAEDPLNTLDDDNVYLFSFNLLVPSYRVCPLFDTSRSFKAGRVAPLKIQLCDASGSNLSDPALILTATGLAQLDGSASSLVEPESPGQANADSIFRYDATLGGYIFNLSTAGLTTGTWELQFRVSGESAVYAVKFDVR
jgi:Tol biopolymer transport system component